MTVTREQLDAYGLTKVRHGSDAAEPLLVGLHFHLHAYICGNGCVKPSPFEAWATFTQIFQQRPNNCRFAVAQMVPLKQQFGHVGYKGPEGDFLCWDLYDDDLLVTQRARSRARNDGLLGAPVPKWQGPSADALVMKAMALYDRE